MRTEDRVGSGFRLGLRCCFCGGDLAVDEACHNTRCSHCGSVLRVRRADGIQRFVIRDELQPREVKFHIDRFLKETDQPLVKKWHDLTQVYLPFWRVRGTTFTITEKHGGGGLDFGAKSAFTNSQQARADVRIVPREITLCANRDQPWALDSLGVRTQVLHLFPLSEEIAGLIVQASSTVTREEALARFTAATSGLALVGASSGSSVLTKFVGVDTSLIVFPIWLATFTNDNGTLQAQFDPVASRVLSIRDEHIEFINRDDGKSHSSSVIDTIPHRCPNCGDDLSARDRSITHYCGNCRRLFLEAGDGYCEAPICSPSEIADDHVLFPFWVFRWDGSSCAQADDLTKALKLAGLRDRCFTVPAFDVGNPSRLMRLVQRYNQNWSVPGESSLRPRVEQFADAVVSPSEAREMMAPLIEAAKAARGYRSYEAPIGGPVAIPEPQLVWMPYVAGGYFWRDVITGATIERAAVSLVE